MASEAHVYINKLAILSRPPGVYPFPVKELPEMRKTKTWSKDKLMSAQTWFALQKRIYDNLEVFNQEQVILAAADLELHVKQVSSIRIGLAKLTLLSDLGKLGEGHTGAVKAGRRSLFA